MEHAVVIPSSSSPPLKSESPAIGAAKPTRVAMLVNNPCTNDSRVIREAEALASAGYEVTVLAIRPPGLPAREMRNGVTYHRVINTTDAWYSPEKRRSKLLAHCRSYSPLMGSFHWLFGYGISWLANSPLPLRRLRCNLQDNDAQYENVSISPREEPTNRLRNRLHKVARRLADWPAYLPKKTMLPARICRFLAPPKAWLTHRITQYRRRLAPFKIWQSHHLITRSIDRFRLLMRQPFTFLQRTTWKAGTAGWYGLKKAAAFLLKAALVPLLLLSLTVRAVKTGSTKISNRCAAVLRRIRRPFTLWAKRIAAAAFIFEFVDLSMRLSLRRLKPDIIHAHDLMTLPTASRVASELGAKLVYDSHELEMHRNADYPKFAWMRRGQLEKKHIRRTALTITVSDSIADHLRDTYKIPRPGVILNAPPLDIPRADAGATIRSTLGLTPETPLAIYVGSVTINRGIEMCVRALRHYPGLHFATLGPRRKPNEIELLEIAYAEGVSDRFHMVDPVLPDEVVSFVKDADVSVLPIQNVCLSYYYCMPNKLFESVIAGLPVAVANLVELRRFTEKYRCGVVMDETDPRDIARAVREVVKNRECYLLRDDQLRDVQLNYCWSAQAEKLVQAYRRL